MDSRLHIRGTVYQTEDKHWLFGSGISFYLPSGSRFSYGGDGALSTAINVSVETYVRDVILAVNTGIHWRPTGVVGELAVGDEWTLGVGGYLPLREGKYRVGGSLVMSTGTERLRGQSGVESSTFFSAGHTPLERMAQGRMWPEPTKQPSGGGRA